MIKNPFKISEDPHGLASKRVLTKEEMKYCEIILAKAARLKVLDINGKIDRDLCFRLLHKLKYEEDF